MVSAFLENPFVKLTFLLVGLFFWVTLVITTLNTTALGLFLYYVGCFLYGLYIGDIIGKFIVDRFM